MIDSLNGEMAGKVPVIEIECLLSLRGFRRVVRFIGTHFSRGGHPMKANTLPIVRIVGSLVAAVLLFMSVALAEEVPQQQSRPYAGVPSDPQLLSKEEYQEYVDLVSDLQHQLNREAQSLMQSPMGYQWLSPDRVHLNLRIEDWLHTIHYVKGATVNLPLFLSDPPQIQTQLQIQLKNDKVVVDDVILAFPVRPSLHY
jgi:hypothetical protein